LHFEVESTDHFRVIIMNYIQPCQTLIALSALCLAISGNLAQADAAYPSKAIKLVVPLASGGPSDAAARALARSLATRLSTDVIVENRPGANGAIGASTVLTAAADGYTLLFAPLSMAGLPSTMKKPPFASMSEMAVVGSVHGNTMCVFAHPSLAVSNLKSLVDYARANPNKLSYGASSLGEYLVMSHLIKAAGIDLVRVPYKGSAQMMPDFLEGRVHLAAVPVRAGSSHAAAGKLKTIGCVAPKRVAALADSPTLGEAGLTGIPTATGHVIAAPAKTPAAIIERLSEALLRAFDDPALRREMEQLQLTGDVQGAKPTLALIRETEVVWQQFVRDAAIDPE
jgi:tripartite-type tricarboxylate transporter receptor subunit TctC